ncbi:DNA polymerase III subunit delta' [Solilutibacter silvestris]|uniref:DNA-directed DNA polymerase n=1 Tax=Solilutibacter silvestris TaxID=1645665 RepID=A0A2K1PZP2_9GAMM|nr:DNA polymerase III subunit delta' [Lysobacter silvestris]PNS08259.1 holB: DNA polymerase III, delta' subunit [Lysobacter silvestris]
MTAGFAPWQQAAYTRATVSLDEGRLGHALLVCGPTRIGKRALVDHLAKRVLCLTPDADGEPCGRCRSCTLFPTGAHPDLRIVKLEMNKEGTRLRSEIVIDQARDVGAWLSLTSQLGGAQVVIVDPADAMNTAAANALLKTLEEPLPNRYLWLVCAQPNRLPATIRSRCQRLELTLPNHADALQWLLEQGQPRADAEAALAAAQGDPGQALLWLTTGGMALRKQVDADLRAIASGNSGAMEIAQRWAADGDAAQRLRFAADLALEQATRLTAATETRRLAKWFDQANRVRDLLRTTVRADLAIAGLLLEWRTGNNGRTEGARRA